MRHFRGRRPEGYDGQGRTSWTAAEVLAGVIQSLTQSIKERPDLVLAAWPEVIGPQLAPMTEALSFINGVLTVKVKNATLYSLLSTREKSRVLADLRKRFPKTTLINVAFRRG